MLFYIAFLFILISEVNTNEDGKEMEQFRIIGGQRFKKMLEGRDTDCFRSWMQNADVRCKSVNKITYRNLTAQLVACEAERDQRKIVNCSKEEDFKTCFATLDEKDLDNYAAFFPEISGYCANVLFQGKSVPEEFLEVLRRCELN